MKEPFLVGVKILAETLMKISLSDGHEGEVSYSEIKEIAKNLGVEIEEKNIKEDLLQD